MSKLTTGSELIMDAAKKIGFAKQGSNNCTFASIQNAIRIETALRRPKIAHKLEYDKTFSERFRKRLGINSKVGVHMGKIAEELKKEPIIIDFGVCKVRLGNLIPIRKERALYEQYIGNRRPLIVSMTYRRKTSSAINPRPLPPVWLPTKHNAVLCAILPDELFEYRNNGGTLKDVSTGLCLWFDSSSKTSYKGYPDGLKAMPIEFLNYKGNLWLDGISSCYSPSFRILKK